LIGNESKRDIYWAMASFAGHSSPAVTFNNYFHFSDMLVGYLVNNRCDQYSKDLISNISGLSQTQLDEAFGKDKEIAVNQLLPILQQVNRRATKSAPKVKKYKIVMISQVPQKLNINTCYQVLLQHPKGVVTSDILSTYHIKNELFEKWVNNAIHVAGRLTWRNNARVNSINYVKRRLLPAPLKSKSERDFFEALLLD